MRGTVILTNFEFSSTIIGKVSHLSGGFSGYASLQAKSCQTLPGLPRPARPSGRFAEGKTPQRGYNIDRGDRI